MSYKVGFQPAGVRHDRSEEFQDMRKLASEERDKEEGRLGRRWAKVSCCATIGMAYAHGPAGRPSLQPYYAERYYTNTNSDSVPLLVILAKLASG